TFQEDKSEIEKLISRVKELWPDVPQSEQQCLEKAASLLELGLETSSAIETTREEVELILLIARIWMKAGDTRKAKNLGFYSRERIGKYEASLEKGAQRATAEQSGELRRLKLTQTEVLNLLSDLT